MITSIARQSIIIKCNGQQAVLLGNYELYYAAGLMKKLFDLPLSEDQTPQELMDIILPAIDTLNPKDARETHLLNMLRTYLPLEQYDDQMKELFHWGANEQDLWIMNTSHDAYH